MNTIEPSDQLALRQRSTLSTLIAERIEGSILSGDLAAGERINEAVLAKELGVSRGPIREAARLLVSRGLVEFIANKGAYVREIAPEEMREIYDLRALLTGQACALAAQKAGEEGVARLNDLHERMSKAAEKSEADEYYRLNLEFHDVLVELADSPRLKEFLAGLVREAHLFRQVSLLRHPDMSTSNEEHGRIVEAIASGDEHLAREQGEAHVRAGKRRFEAAWSKT